jgi:hypothetical protein
VGGVGVGSGYGKGRKTINNKVNVYLPMYMSDLRHIHDPVLSSLKMEGLRFFSADVLSKNFTAFNIKLMFLYISFIDEQ